jgi:RNA polymerase sigma-70 factor (ECF subfamily)
VLALPPRYREPVVLFYFHEMDLGAAARTMGLPEGTMKARLSRARALLRRRFPQLKAQNTEMDLLALNKGKEA